MEVLKKRFKKYKGKKTRKENTLNKKPFNKKKILLTTYLQKLNNTFKKIKKRITNCHGLFLVLDVKEGVSLSVFLWKEKMIYQNLEKIYLSFQKNNQALFKHPE